MIKIKLLLVFQALVLLLVASSQAQEMKTTANPKLQWKSELPSLAKDAANWEQLGQQLQEAKLYYGSMAAAQRMILFFEDVKTKRMAFEQLISVIDVGYPNSLLNYFMLGNLELIGDDEFTQNYNFYKAVINKMKGMQKWSTEYFARLDPEKFNKYQFYLALEDLSQKNYSSAQKKLESILLTPLSPSDFSFVKKIVRTLARSYFEQKNYEKSLLYYDDFLLKIQPLTPSDWLEKAWNQFYLKRYEDALGTLYNLEAQSAQQYNTFERYIVRASIYLNLCATDNVKKLIERFEEDHKASIDAIINGKQLSKIEELEQVARFSEPHYKQALDSLQALSQERDQLEDVIDEEYLELAQYLYDSEIKVLRQMARFFREKALNRAAYEMTMLSESLRFLQYSTEREKYNPAVVFMPRDEASEVLIEEIDLADRGFVFQWRQQGQFWRDERNKYKGNIKNYCLDDIGGSEATLE